MVQWLDNRQETRALVPNIVLDRTVTSTMVANVSFVGYGDVCTVPGVASGVIGDCDPAVSVLVPEAVFDKNGARTGGQSIRTCAVRPDFDELSVSVLNCIALPCAECVSNVRSCTVLWRCTDCQIGAQSSVMFVLSQPLSFASFIAWNFTCDSGVPDQTSSASSFLFPSSSAQVLRGLTPSSVSLTLTPTVYSKVSDNSTTSGYLLEFASNTTGTTVDSGAFQYVRSVLFQYVRFAVCLACLRVECYHAHTVCWIDRSDCS